MANRFGWVVFAALSCGQALAESEQFGSFSVLPEEPTIAVMVGAITPNLPLDFRRMLRKYPDIGLLALHSEGGDVTAALLVADEVHSRGIDTYIPDQSGCYSACAFVFFSGEYRLVDGVLGVHQIYGDVPDDYSTQVAIADILESMTAYGVPSSVINDMLRTPPDSMTIFGAQKAEFLGLNRRDEQSATATVAEPPEPRKVPVFTAPPSTPSNMNRLDPKYSTDFGGGWIEETHQIHEDLTIDAALTRIGLLQADFAPFVDILSNSLSSGTLPAWTEIEIVLGPATNAAGDFVDVVPMRISLFTPRPPDGKLVYLATAERVKGRVVNKPYDNVPPAYQASEAQPGFQEGLQPGVEVPTN